MNRAALVLILLAAFAPRAFAHEVRPAYLELRQTAAETFDVLWKVPGKGDNLRLGLYVELPAGCTNVTEPRGTMANNALTERWTVRRSGGMAGGTIRVAGLGATMTDVLVRLEYLDGTAQVARLSPAVPTLSVEAVPRAADVARAYTILGIEHILGGLDHLLYIAAMLFLIKGWRRVLLTMSAFTATHSLTLTAAALGFVRVPSPPVEASIALSIVFVAREIVYARRGQPGLTARWPWVVSFTFGLLHGLGFAGALSEVGLPPGAIPVALLFFNVGVEVGQVLFIFGVLGACGGAVWVARAMAARAGDRLAAPWAAERFAVAAAYVIGAVAMFWVIERTLTFWA